MAINSFDGTTLEDSLKELDEFISDGTVRDWVVSHPLMIIPISLIFMLLIDLAIVLFIAVIVSFVTHQPINISMCVALFLLALIPSILVSFSICDEIFVRPNRFEKLKEKTLGSGYEISKDIIDCPISVKQRLFEEVEHHCLAIKRVGNRMFVFDSKTVEPRDFLYTTKEEIYFKEQLEENRWYNIVDIITDVEVA